MESFREVIESAGIYGKMEVRNLMKTKKKGNNWTEYNAERQNRSLEVYYEYAT